MIDDLTKPTALFLGRFQPWHSGHRAIFQQILTRSDPEYRHKSHDAQNVCIMVRYMEVDDDNPFTFTEISEMINRDLWDEYQGRYLIMQVPNITDLFVGRSIGFDVHRIHLSEDLEPLDTTTTRLERATLDHKFWKNRG